jgi:multisubunit Na+/H+ antiporter MnhG subunit
LWHDLSHNQANAGKWVMNAIHNERIKLTASAIDRASTASLAVGVFGPVASTIYTDESTKHANLGMISLSAFIWLSVAVGLHLLARSRLKGIIA